jgi:hypothetical protein
MTPIFWPEGSRPLADPPEYGVLPAERALVAGVWARDPLGPCEVCGHLSNWHYGGCRHGGSECRQDHAACVLGCREFKGKLRPAPAPGLPLFWALTQAMPQ